MGWRLFFLLAAVFNFAAGLPLLLAPEVMSTLVDMAPPADPLFHRMTGVLVTCFGGLYWFVANDLERYRPLVWLGVVGKAGVVVLFTEAWMSGRVPFQAYAVSLGDALFVAGFLIFLLATGKKTT